MDCFRKCHSKELDSIQTFGDLFCSFHASRLQPFVFNGQKYQLRLKRDEIGVVSVPSVHNVKTPEEETNRDVRMKRREVRLTFVDY